MRKYTIVFMEQKIGDPRLTPLCGPDGEASFEAQDDEAALELVNEHYATRVKHCVRAELSSLAIATGEAGRHGRLVDDSLENPHFQESYIRYDVRTQRLEVDFVSTATAMLPDIYRRAWK